MNLDKFQQEIKKGAYSADLDADAAKRLLQIIDENKRIDLMDSIELCLDMSTIVSNAVHGVSNQSDIDGAIVYCVNEAIEEALAEIEDIEEEAENNEPCDIESFKRDRELNQ